MFELARIVRDYGTQRIDLMLAGDLFDLHRTEPWFEKPELRPYVKTPGLQPGDPLEALLLHLLDRIVRPTSRRDVKRCVNWPAARSITESVTAGEDVVKRR